MAIAAFYFTVPAYRGRVGYRFQLEPMKKALPDLKTGGVLGKYEIQKGLACAKIKDLHRMKLGLTIHLPTKGIDLQRPFVWTIAQQESFIESIILRRHFPPVSFVFTVEDVYEVVDGKQRITTLLRYLADEFEFCGYLHKDLPEDYRFLFDQAWLLGDRLLEPFNSPLTDDKKIEWFYWLNFAGTEQDLAHRENLMGLLSK